ncbi:MAG: DUF4350 domain-containing protein [Saprospiraceae bacterium]|nr:DUF4350 domain-containing protein [Saprospiraceae bacterium]
MFKIAPVTLLLITCVCSTLTAQQIPDTTFEMGIIAPRYAPDKGPLVTVDAAHHNFHTLENRYAPFGRVLHADGYQLHSNTQKITPEGLKNTRVYVISNPLDSSNIGNWTLPTPSAFSAKEISALHDWVQNGGRLLLIADHMPFAGAAQELAQAFGFEYLNCFAFDNRQRNTERFYRGNQSLLEHDITKGVDTVVTFTGSAFRIPPGAQPLISLKNYTLTSPRVAWQFEEDTPTQPADGFYQGACMVYGKGKLVVMGEAAMFTAQLAGPARNQVGFNQPEARQNIRLLRNILHWLDQ